jgi:hypothetical protein
VGSPRPLLPSLDRKMPLRLILCVIVAVGLVACGGPDQIVKTLRLEISSYASAPTPEAEAKIEQGFETLNTAIQKLEAKGKTSESAALRKNRSDLQTQYDAARLAATIHKAKGAVKQIGEAFQQAGKEIGEAFQTPTPLPQK